MVCVPIQDSWWSFADTGRLSWGLKCSERKEAWSGKDKRLLVFIHSLAIQSRGFIWPANCRRWCCTSDSLLCVKEGSEACMHALWAVWFLGVLDPHPVWGFFILLVATMFPSQHKSLLWSCSWRSHTISRGWTEPTHAEQWLWYLMQQADMSLQSSHMKGLPPQISMESRCLVRKLSKSKSSAAINHTESSVCWGKGVKWHLDKHLAAKLSCLIKTSVIAV